MSGTLCGFRSSGRLTAVRSFCLLQRDLGRIRGPAHLPRDGLFEWSLLAALGDAKYVGRGWAEPTHWRGGLVAALRDLARHPLHKRLDCFVGLVARSVADVDVIGFRLAAADDCHVRNLARLRVTDLALHAL